MDKSLLLLLIGIIFVFISMFGGGLKYKDLVLPKVGNFPRVMGAIFGVLLVGSSFLATGEIKFAAEFPWIVLTEGTTEEIKTVSAKPVDPPEQNEPITGQTSEDEPPLVKPGPTLLQLLSQKVEDTEANWNNTEINNDLLLKEYQLIKANDEFENLGLVARNTVGVKLGDLEQSIALLTRANTLAETQDSTLNEKILEITDVIKKLDGKNYRVSDRKREEIKALAKSLGRDAVEYANVKNKEHILTCVNVENNECTKSISSFRDQDVWLWVKFTAPKDEKISIRWVDDEGKEVYTNQFSIQKSSGYRIRARKHLTDAGGYQARVYNEQGQLIAQTNFSVR